jgi:hypothetical protein
MVQVSSKLDAIAYVFAPLLLEGSYRYALGVRAEPSIVIYGPADDVKQWSN